MIAYPDTSYLCALFRTQDNSPEATRYWQGMSEPLHVTTLLEFEFLQSIRLQVWLQGQDRRKGYGQREADAMIAQWELTLAGGSIKMAPYDMHDVLRYAATLSSTYSSQGGHRTLDVLHVATAIHLGAREFLTFDAPQKKLATAAGLQVPL